MRFVFGPVPDDPAFEPEKSGWRSFREPDPVMLNLLALPVAFVLLGGLVVYIKAATVVPLKEVVLRVFPAFLIIIPLHELLHALVTPRFGTTPQTYMGCWPARALFYAHYIGELSARRFFAVLLTPFIVITVIPLAVITALDVHAPWTAAMALANGVGAAGDLLGLFVMGAQVPRGSIVRNKGWRTYWRRRALITTERLVLRPVETSDVDALHALWCDADVRRYLWDDVVIPRGTAEIVVRNSSIDWRERGYGLWSVLEAGELAGFVGFRSSQARAEPELLFGFHPRFWHRGLATEAVQAALAWIGRRTIWAATDPPNAASIRLMERIGMRQTYRGILDGHDAVFFERLHES